jgi:Ni,Fe-hydrogenase I cytochrome b subunit
MNPYEVPREPSEYIDPNPKPAPPQEKYNPLRDATYFVSLSLIILAMCVGLVVLAAWLH